IYRAGIVVATGIADGDGNWSATTGVLDDGYASYTARAVDAAGNAGIPSDSLIVITDTTAPGLPAIGGYSDDTGVAGDDVTRDNTLTLTGTAQATSTRVVIYDNGTEIGTAIVVGGAWTFTTPSLANGEHALTVAARDYVGNESSQTAPLEVTIDTLAPSAPAITGFSDDTGTLGDG